MLSSDAENFFWLSRYVERAENTAKLVNVNIELLLDFVGNKSEGWKPVIEITGMKDFFQKKYNDFNEINSVKFLSQDTDNNNSILSCLEKAQYNARPIRDNLPRSSIHQLNVLLKNFNDQIKSTSSRRKRTLIISEVTSGTQLFFGIISDRYFSKPHDLSGLLESKYNSFEEVVLKNYPELMQTKYWLSSFGKVRMSGTGSTLYIEFDSYESAIKANKEIGNRYRSKMVSSLESYDIFS